MTTFNGRNSPLLPDSNPLNETVTLEEPAASRRRPAPIQVPAPDSAPLDAPPLDAPLTNKRLLQDHSHQGMLSISFYRKDRRIYE